MLFRNSWISHYVLYALLKSEVLSVFCFFRKILKSDYYLHHICLSVLMEQLGSH
jgi:hypothetical protein